MIAPVSTLAARNLPKAQRTWLGVCNEGWCGKLQHEDTGYCQWHSSAEYAARLKLRRRVLWWVLWGGAAAAGLPIAVTLCVLLWKMAAWSFSL